MWYQQSTGVQTHWHRESATKGTEAYQHIESVVPKTDHVVPVEQRDSLANTVWYHGYQGYRGVPTHMVSGTKDSTCGTSRVLGCKETHWHRERGTRGTKGTEGYQHIESVVPKTQHVVPAEYWGAERLTGTESLVPGVPRVPRGTNT